MEEKLSLGDEMKKFEGEYAKQKLDSSLPICVRIDGKTFSTFTRGLKKPFDERLSSIMIEVTKFLVEKTGAQMGYTQSDEITLAYFKLSENQQAVFGGRVQKMTSILASMATARFAQLLGERIEEKAGQIAFFDARAWTVPTLNDCARVFLWRQEDAIKNSISMAAHELFSHKQLLKKTSKEKIEMMKEIGVDWEQYPEFFKSGTFAYRVAIEEKMSDELKEFKSNQGKDYFIRSDILTESLPRLSRQEGVESFLFDRVFSQKETNLIYKKKAQKF